MIKVCHMTSAHSSNDVRIFQKECISLAGAGYMVYLVAQGESYVKDGVQIVGIGKPPRSRFNRMTKTAKEIYERAFELDADIYHLHDPELLPYAKKLKEKGKKVIFDSHEDIPQQIREKTWIYKPLRNIVAKIIERYQNSVCKKMDAVISVTPHICKKLELVNPNTLMITNYPIINESNSCIESNKNNKTICFAGNITEQWGHADILEALKYVKDVKYVFCGVGHADYINKLKDNSSWDKVNYKGVIPHSEVYSLLSSSGVGMALLRKGGNTGGQLGTLGNTKLFEYMSAEIPFICTDFTLWKKIVNEYNCGICVDPCNLEEIINAIQYMIDNPTKAAKMGRNGRRAVCEKYNWSIEEKKLLELYSKI